VEALFRKLLEAVGEDPARPGLKDTPRRAADAFRFFTSGYHQNLADIVTTFAADIDEMVVVKDVELYSLCEHHLIPFFGKCHVAYLPNDKLIGVSKIPRIVDMFARRLQIQEVLTKQIAHCLMDAIDPKGVGVVIEARHLCMMMRGVEKQNSVMTTSCMLKAFRTQPQTRAEFLNLIKS
jgi:GTP cyclohydrolase I